jgi:hypothetical protein
MIDLGKQLRDKSQIIVCSHDAGGAEVLSSYVREHQIDARFLISGPAIPIFSRKCNLTPENTLDILPQDFEILLSSTGWQTDFEFKAMQIALLSEKRVIAVLDHWVSYEERFTRSNSLIKVPEILVFDQKAREIAKEIFPDARLYVSENFYRRDSSLEYISNKNKNLTEHSFDILFLCEPMASTENSNQTYGYDEYQVLEYFFSVLKEKKCTKFRILLRPHPSEFHEKYLSKIDSEFTNVKINTHRTLAECIAESEIIVGCNTMAMIVALDIGKRVYSVVPYPMKSTLQDSRIELFQDWQP